MPKPGYPPDRAVLQALIEAWQARNAGQPLEELATRLGVSNSTRQKWTQANGRKMTPEVAEKLIDLVPHLPYTLWDLLPDAPRTSPTRSRRKRTEHAGSFVTWHRKRVPLAQAPVIGPPGLVKIELGLTALLDVVEPDRPVSLSFSATEHDYVRCLRDNCPPGVDIQQFLDVWKVEEERLAGEYSERKVSPASVAMPIGPSNTLNIRWTELGWSKTRSLHRVIENNDKYRLAFSHSIAHDVQHDCLLPGIFCNQIIVVLDDRDDGPMLLFGQRAPRSVMYNEGRWSASIEEQFRPHESLEECTARGLREELFGDRLPAFSATYVGCVLEHPNLNLGAVTIVYAQADFRDVVDAWQVAEYKNEHIQLAAVPLDRLVEHHLPTDDIDHVVQSMMRSSAHDVLARTKRWSLHPTAAVRIAISTWLHTLGGAKWARRHAKIAAQDL